MNIFQRLKYAFTGENILGGGLPGYGYSTSFYLNSNQPILIDCSNLMQVYKDCPHLQIVINKRAEMLSNAQIKIVSIKDEEKEIESHPVLDLLKKPNPLQTTEEFLAQYSLYRDIYGNAIIYKLAATSTSLPKALWNLPLGQFEVVPTGKMFNQTKLENIIKEYRIMTSKGWATYKPSEIIHKAFLNSDKVLVGESKIPNLALPISNIIGALKTRNILIYKKGAIGILSSANKDSDGGLPLTKDERKRIHDEYQNTYGLNDEQSQIIITESNLSWNAMSYPTKELMLFEEIEDDFASILGAYGMPRDLFPSTKGATFENQEQAEQGAYNNTIQPMADDIMSTLSEQFGLTAEGLKLVADFDWLPLMQADKTEEQSIEKSKTEEYSQLSGVIANLNTQVGTAALERDIAINILVNIHKLKRSIANSVITAIVKEPKPEENAGF